MGRKELQLSLNDVEPSLAHTTFVIVDLETTGGSSRDCAITEIGAVKVRGGELLGEFTTLVNPGMAIPPFIAALTGITNADVASAPSVSTAVAMFIEFAGDAAVVAHNAPFDLGFLQAACEKFDLIWTHGPVIDTARLARVALQRDEVRNCKLGTLAAYFRTETEPTHRALDDARATTEVFHHLIARVGSLGVSNVSDLRAFTGRVTTAQRTKRHLADGLPTGPGVYIFEDREGCALYIGTSRNIRQRVKTYFTASEQRRRMSEMVTIAQSVRAIECGTALEARIRERRLIVSEQPRYNRRSRRASEPSWLKLTGEVAPRLSIVKNVLPDTAAGAVYFGPFSSHASARMVADALEFVFPIRTCTTKLAAKPTRTTAACALAELGKCAAPCRKEHDSQEYAHTVAHLRSALAGETAHVIQILTERMDELASEQRFEEAARWRERLTHYLAASVRTHRLALIASEPEIVAAQVTGAGGWDIHVIRHGSLAAAGSAAPGVDPKPILETLVSTAAHVEPQPSPLPAGTPEEALDLMSWLESDGVRLVQLTHSWSLPRNVGGSWLMRYADARHAIDAFIHDAGTRPAGPLARPATRISLTA